MMEELENQTAVDPFSEEAIIASLPLEAQGEMRSYGAMENKTIDELHEILLHMREKYSIPPWHPFTYLMKWYAAAEVHGPLQRGSMWAHPKYRHKEIFDTGAVCGTKNWCDLTLHVVSSAGSKEYQAKLYVEPTKKIAWSPISETPRSGHCILCYADDGSSYCANARWDEMFDAAGKLLAEGKVSGTYEYYMMSASEAGRRSAESRRRNREIGNVQPRKCCVKRKEPDKIVTPVTSEKQSEQLDKRILIPMFELAKAKALELGMTETVKLWEEALHV